jgi:hypothetical protein
MIAAPVRDTTPLDNERDAHRLVFFEFVHNVRRRRKALLGFFVGLLLKPSPRNTE